MPLPNPMNEERLHLALSTDGRRWKPLAMIIGPSGTNGCVTLSCNAARTVFGAFWPPAVCAGQKRPIPILALPASTRLRGTW